jgi:hypothetical protein
MRISKPSVLEAAVGTEGGYTDAPSLPWIDTPGIAVVSPAPDDPEAGSPMRGDLEKLESREPSGSGAGLVPGSRLITAPVTVPMVALFATTAGGDSSSTGFVECPDDPPSIPGGTNALG